jgi:DNA helicase HerA-like ATPase
LRAFTPRDQKAVRTAAETFVPNPHLDVAQAISQLGVGEALVSMLLEKGVPMPVERTLIAPPRCRMGSITDAERAHVRAGSPVGAKYDSTVDRESASEMLAARHDGVPIATVAIPAKKAATDAPSAGNGLGQSVKDIMFGTSRRQGVVESMAKQAARTVGSQVGRQILRGVLGGIFGGRR